MTPPRLQPLRGTFVGGATRRDPRVYEFPNLPDAACATSGAEPDLWHFDGRGATATAARDAAIEICHTCPSEQACLDYAIEHRIDHGVFGGKTASQRRRLHRGGLS